MISMLVIFIVWFVDRGIFDMNIRELLRDENVGEYYMICWNLELIFSIFSNAFCWLKVSSIAFIGFIFFTLSNVAIPILPVTAIIRSLSEFIKYFCNEYSAFGYCLLRRSAMYMKFLLFDSGISATTTPCIG